MGPYFGCRTPFSLVPTKHQLDPPPARPRSARWTLRSRASHCQSHCDRRIDSWMLTSVLRTSLAVITPVHRDRSFRTCSTYLPVVASLDLNLKWVKPWRSCDASR